MEKKSGFGKFLVGAAVGVGLGVLFAPKSGAETRADLKNKFDDVVDKIKSIDAEEVKKSMQKKVKEIKEELASLDGEKVYKIAVAKTNDIKKKLGELKDMAIEKGTPVVENAVDALRTKTIDVLNATVKKLEK